ncbi:uncharacterized protein B0J16DRAFT_330369 [Fusarium flagelliforme]|uniref:CFEM domain-containing protein n=1 Tax=Fusarium flagelliforme TaxID=2675880 RepID=A0A395N3T2_9HYPO|nr:uncharacterized protein B0J16DRAFT_330369 [Fusarium flagelliforme]KAH7198444.1 hypothetical protein B0J16DRAFT_330369 [Fusarium flagelliforme]RFN54788.1 hypothetical protein FIE12Z_962 [Fusarium flagelliforme]
MRKPTAAQLALLMASVARAAESTCAIDCFQGLITNGPPEGCKEATNYMCFCTMPTLQENFSKCADTSCSKEKDAAMGWANDLCAKLGKPIDLGSGGDAPKTDATTAVDAPATTVSEAKPTTEAEKTTTEAAQTTSTDAEKTESKVEETSEVETSDSETSAPPETSEVPEASETSGETSETCTTETTMTKTETTFASEATAATTDNNGSVGTVTGSGEAATASASSNADVNAGSITAPDFFAAAGVVAAVWQLL